MVQIHIRPISAEKTRPLRQSILRPGYPPELSIYPLDHKPGTFHAGAFQGDKLVGTASLNQEPPPFSDEPQSWRLRGMAVVEEWRGRGIGKELLEACLLYAKDQNGMLVWCNARESVIPFIRGWALCPTGMHSKSPRAGLTMLCGGN